ncbi:MAG: capsular biosynthesis protein [Chromatocurvus sp.]
MIDVDGTLTNGDAVSYADVTPRQDVVEMLRHYRSQEFEIVLYTARNMRTHQSSLGLINAKTLPVLFDWLHRHDIPYDEIWTGKPWCGNDGFYVDDKAIRPDEFVSLSYNEIRTLVGILPE